MKWKTIISACFVLWSTSALAVSPHKRIEKRLDALELQLQELEGRVSDLESAGGEGSDGTLTLQNDSFVAGGQAAITANAFSGNDEYAATLGPIAGTSQLQKVRIFVGPGGAPTFSVGVKVYQESGNAVPGTVLYESQTTYQITPSDTALNEIDLTPANVVVNGGSTIRVSILFIESPGAAGPAHDVDGFASSGRNWLKLNGQWVSAEGVQLSGDWIFRAVVDPM